MKRWGAFDATFFRKICFAVIPSLPGEVESTNVSPMRVLLVVFFLLGGVPGLRAFDPSDQDDSLSLVRHFVETDQPLGPGLQPGSYEPITGETITLMGGVDVVRMQDFVEFDMAMLSAFPDKALRIRNLGWSGDTVYRQQRPMFFYTKEGDSREGSVPDLRSKIDPGTMLLMFGKMESLDGLDRLQEFESAYDGLITELKTISSRVVLVAPSRFIEIGPAAELAESRNETLETYLACIDALAEKHGAIFFDPGEFEKIAYADNGVYLSDVGQKQLAVRLASVLGWRGQWFEGVEKLVTRKNVLWDQYYRPTNWAFLFGDRQNVPSSRDHEDTDKRWFEEELNRIPTMISDVEKELWKFAEGVKP